MVFLKLIELDERTDSRFYMLYFFCCWVLCKHLCSCDFVSLDGCFERTDASTTTFWITLIKLGF